MNKLKTTDTGGFPLTLNDFRFIDDSVRLAIYDLAKALSGLNTARLYGGGLVNKGTFYEVSEGAVLYNGEIFHIYPHNVAVTGGVAGIFLNFISESHPEGSKIFFDGTQHQVYEVRKAVVSINTPIEGALASIMYPEVEDIQSILRDNRILTLTEGCTPAVGVWKNIAIMDRGRVSIECGINAEVGLGRVTHVFTLPPEYCPKGIIGGSLMLTNLNDASIHFGGYTLSKTGVMSIDSPTLNPGAKFRFYLIVPPYLV